MTTSTTSIDIMGLQAAYANLHTDQERDYFMQRYHDVISSFGGKTSYDADNRSEERFSRNAETDLVCRLLLEKKNSRGTTQAPAARIKHRRTTQITMAVMPNMARVGI